MGLKRTPLLLRLAVLALPRDSRDEVLRELLEQHQSVARARGRAAAVWWALRQPLAAIRATQHLGVPPHSPQGDSLMTSLVEDVVASARALRHRGVLAVTVVLTMAVGIGAIAATWSVIDAVLLRPLPFPQADKLVWLNSYQTNWTLTEAPPTASVYYANPSDVADWMARSRAFAGITAYETFEATMQAGESPLRVDVANVTASVGDVLRITPALGRLFTPGDYAKGVRVAVLSHALWRTAFGGDRGIIGRSLPIDGEPFEVIGVLADAPLMFPEQRTDLWLPLRPAAIGGAVGRRGGVWQRVVARVRDDATLPLARADADRVAGELATEYPQTNGKRRLALAPFRDGLVGSTRTVLVMIGSVVAAVLLIACANVGQLLLVSAQARRREFALRAALGAHGRRLAQLMIVESALLAAGGGLLGLGLAAPLVTLFLSLYPGDLPAVGAVGVSLPALGVALGATLVAALVAAVPTLLAVRARHLVGSMRSTDRGSDGRGQRRARSLLVFAQVSLSTALLIGGVLLIRSFASVRATDLGFSPEHLLTLNVALSERRYPSLADEARFHGALADRVKLLPGVTAAGATTLLPLAAGEFRDGFSREGVNDTFPNLPIARLQNVTPGYLEAIGMPLKRGRTVSAADDGAAPAVAVVNDTLETKFFPDGALGRRIRFRDRSIEIVGVVGSKRHRSLREAPQPDLYLPAAQSGNPRLFSWLAIRSSQDVAPLVPAIRSIVHDLDPSIALDNIATMTDRVGETLAPDLFRASLVGALALTALLLAVLGVFGLTSHAVTRESHDIAIRMALGATRGHTVARVVGRSIRLTGAGVAAGVGLAVAGQELVAGFLAGITPKDPLTIATVAATLLLVATIAAVVPARRAARVDPARALR